MSESVAPYSTLPPACSGRVSGQSWEATGAARALITLGVSDFALNDRRGSKAYEYNADSDVLSHGMRLRAGAAWVSISAVTAGDDAGEGPARNSCVEAWKQEPGVDDVCCNILQDRDLERDLSRALHEIGLPNGGHPLQGRARRVQACNDEDAWVLRLPMAYASSGSGKTWAWGKTALDPDSPTSSPMTPRELSSEPQGRTIAPQAGDCVDVYCCVKRLWCSSRSGRW